MAISLISLKHTGGLEVRVFKSSYTLAEINAHRGKRLYTNPDAVLPPSPGDEYPAQMRSDFVWMFDQIAKGQGTAASFVGKPSGQYFMLKADGTTNTATNRSTTLTEGVVDSNDRGYCFTHAFVYYTGGYNRGWTNLTSGSIFTQGTVRADPQIDGLLGSASGSGNISATVLTADNQLKYFNFEPNDWGAMCPRTWSLDGSITSGFGVFGSNSTVLPADRFETFISDPDTPEPEPDEMFNPRAQTSMVGMYVMTKEKLNEVFQEL